MRRDRYEAVQPQIVELCTFYIGDHQFGIDILKIQEINRNPTITTVPQSQEYIVGVMNLRGRIVTVIDLAKKLGLPFTMPGKDSRTIIVNSQDEYIGLLIDRIGDVVPVDTEKTELPPVNIGDVLGSFTEGVLKTGAGLIGILDVEAVLA
ncbi:MAG: purine-binding chemotaxis protein CheW [Desulfobacteraceae bacterium]|nr:purine-binding chemotaxis protein CheW [Desulfobacteraceae bacterium]